MDPALRRARPDAIAAARGRARRTWALALATALMLATGPARAQEEAGETVIVSHGISTFGDLKYPADFKHFDYVNPDAPKGGTMSFRGTGASQTFDSLNPFILKGEPAQGPGPALRQPARRLGATSPTAPTA